MKLSDLRFENTGPRHRFTASDKIEVIKSEGFLTVVINDLPQAFPYSPQETFDEIYQKAVNAMQTALRKIGEYRIPPTGFKPDIKLTLETLSGRQYSDEEIAAIKNQYEEKRLELKKTCPFRQLSEALKKVLAE